MSLCDVPDSGGLLGRGRVRRRGVGGGRAVREQGVHERTAQQLAGHADGRMTREIYTHVTDTMLQEAAGAIERIMGDGGTNRSSSGSRDDNNAEDDEDQEPGYGA